MNRHFTSTNEDRHITARPYIFALRRTIGLAVCAISLLAVFAVRAAWVYDAGVQTLADGTSGWVFNTSRSVAGALTNLTVTGVKTVGTLSSDVDFRTVEADTGSPLVAVGGAALKKALTSLAFPNSVTILGNYMCESQTTLTNVVLGAGLQTIGDGAFKSCTKLATVTPLLPESVTNVGGSAFYSCPVAGKLSLVNTNGVTVGGQTFRGTKVVDADLSGVTIFGNSVFEGQTSITNLVLGTSLKSIPDHFCSGCSKLATVTPFLPGTVTSVGINAFVSCPVEGILVATNAFGVACGSQAFRHAKTTEAHLNVNGSMTRSMIANAPNLRHVYFHGTPPTVFDDYSHEGITAYRLNFHISTKRLPDYTVLPGFAVATTAEKARADYPGDETTLGTFQSYGSSRQWLTAWDAPGDELPDITLTVNSAYGAPVPAVGTIVLPNLTALDFSVASHRIGMTSYVCTGWTGTGDIPATGSGTSLRTLLTQDSAITWNWQVTEYDKEWIRSGSVLSNAVNRWAFNLSSATAMENLAISSTRTVGFDDEIDFRSVEGDTGCVITSIAGLALKQPLTSVVFPDSVEELGNYMCEGVKSLTNVVLGAGLKTIGTGAFTGCSALASVTPFLPESVTNVGANAFSYCRIPTTLRLENRNGVTLGDRAFDSNPLTGAYFNIRGALPSTIFERCSALRDIWFLGAAPTSFNANSLYNIGAYVVRFHISRKQVPDPFSISGFAEPDATDMAREDYQNADPKPYGTITIGTKRYWVFDWSSPFSVRLSTIFILR